MWTPCIFFVTCKWENVSDSCDFVRSPIAICRHNLPFYIESINVGLYCNILAGLREGLYVEHTFKKFTFKLLREIEYEVHALHHQGLFRPQN